MTQTYSLKTRLVSALQVAMLLLLVGFSFPAQAADATAASSSTAASSTSTQSGLTNCPGEVGKIIQTRLEQSSQFGMAGGQNFIDTTINSVEQNFWQNANKGPSVRDTFCLADVQARFKSLSELLSAASPIIYAITSALAYFANTACTFVKDAVMAAVNSALDLICIPLPDIGYGMQLPDIKRKSCNGYAPLRDLMKVDVIPGLSYSQLVPPNLLTGPLTRWIQKNNLDGSFNYSVKKAITTGNGRF